MVESKNRNILISSFENLRLYHLIFNLGLLVFLSSELGAQPSTKYYDPVYMEIEGWTITMDPRLMEEENRQIADRAIGALTNHLQRITYVVNKERLEQLRQIRLWMELDNTRLNELKMHNMQFHPDRDWLVENGLDPRLVKHVHIPSAAELYNPHMWAKHPNVVLHEIAHAYHNQMLEGGFDNPEILAVYNKAKDSGKYEKVLLYTGKKVCHYGMNNQMEYFSETTESYFGVNDFYPLVRAELKEFDPEGFALMESIWGPLKK